MTRLRQVRARADNGKEQKAWSDTLGQTLRLEVLRMRGSVSTQLGGQEESRFVVSALG